MFEIEVYQKKSGKSPLEDYISSLSKQSRDAEIARIFYYIDLLKEYGLAINNVHPQAARLIRDDIYELRPGKNRVFFFTFEGNNIILLHAYRKESQKAPEHEIEKAISDMNDYKRRYGNGQNDF